MNNTVFTNKQLFKPLEIAEGGKPYIGYAPLAKPLDEEVEELAVILENNEDVSEVWIQDYGLRVELVDGRDVKYLCRRIANDMDMDEIEIVVSPVVGD